MNATGKVAAQRAVTGIVVGMVASVTVLTGVGFWLSYAGLHTFDLHAGLRGPEGWAWPASVDLFIISGEAGVTIATLRRETDWVAWVYLGAGFAVSVAANVLHVDIMFWFKYVAAATPPISAMAALGALMRQIYRIAVDRHVARQKAEAKERKAREPSTVKRNTSRTTNPPRDLTAAIQAYKDSIKAGEPLSARRLAMAHTGGNRRAAARAITLAETS